MGGAEIRQAHAGDIGQRPHRQLAVAVFGDDVRVHAASVHRTHDSNADGLGLGVAHGNTHNGTIGFESTEKARADAQALPRSAG